MRCILKGCKFGNFIFRRNIYDYLGIAINICLMAPPTFSTVLVQSFANKKLKFFEHIYRYYYKLDNAFDNRSCVLKSIFTLSVPSFIYIIGPQRKY